MENDIVRMLFLRRQRQKKRWKIKTISGAPPLSFKAKAGALKDYRIYGQTSRNLSEVNEFSNFITDPSDKLQIWVQQGKDQSFEYPANSNIFVITEPTTITTRITITNDNDSIRIKHNGSMRDIVIDVVRGLSHGVYSVSFNVLDYDQTTVGGIVINNIMVNTGSTPLPYEPYGESVGDRTGNLFSAKLTQGGYSSVSTPNSYQSRVRSSDNDFVFLNAGTYTISWDSGTETAMLMYAYNSESIDDYNSIIISAWTSSPVTFSVTSDVFVLVVFKKENNKNIIPKEISNIMLNEGSTALPYEPYGYRVPVTVSNGTDTQTIPIYLTEQIRKVGDEAEYIDYGEQKQHFADGTSVDVELPALPTLSGTNTLSVGTTVKPSGVEITGRIKSGISYDRP